MLGSFFGAMGTVAGAALGSVFSAIVTALYQHSLDKTRDTVKARIKLPGGGTVKVASTTEVPAPRGGSDQASTRVFVTPGDQPTEVISAVPAVDAGPPKSRRRLLVMAGFTVVVFAIGMLAITGIELVKGSPLNTSSSSTSERSGGTSLGSVLGRSDSASTDTSTETSAPEETESAEPTSEADNSDESDEDGSSAEPGRGFGADEEEPSTSRVTPTPTPESGADEQSDEGSQSDSGAAEQQGGGAAEADEQQSGSAGWIWRQPLRPSRPHGRSRAASAAAAARGSSASVIARTTTTRSAPAASTSSSRSPSIPPIANHGRAGARPATVRTRSSPGAGRPGFVGVGQQGPAQK